MAKRSLNLIIMIYITENARFDIDGYLLKYNKTTLFVYSIFLSVRFIKNGNKLHNLPRVSSTSASTRPVCVCNVSSESEREH